MKENEIIYFNYPNLIKITLKSDDIVLNVIHFKDTSYQEVLVLAIIFSLSNNFFVEDFIIRLVIFFIWTNKNYQDIDRDSCRNVRRV
jgi:hypothetical protein